MKIFISHSSADNQIVEKITKVFDAHNVKYWVDFQQLGLGSRVIEEINKALDSSSIFLLIWTSNASTSPWVSAEKTAAVERNDRSLRKITIKLDDTLLGLPFSTWSYLTADEGALETKIEKLIFDIGDLHSQSIIASRRIIEDYENFDTRTSPMIKEFRKFDGHKLYVPQPYEYLDKRDVPRSNVAAYCLLKIHEEENGVLLIVGPYGSGKSGLCHHLLYRLCQEGRFVFFIPLGRLQKYHDDDKQNLLFEIAEFLRIEYGFNAEEKSLDEFLHENKVVFIFDALDELSPKLDSAIAQNNLKGITNLAANAKVILTSRHTYIAGGIPRELISHHNAIEILDFSDSDIDEFLDLKFDRNQKIIREINDKIRPDMRVLGIIRKPLFLSIFCERFDYLKNLLFINEATLFRSLTSAWIYHDLTKETSVLQEEEKKKIEINQRCSERLAISEFATGLPVTLVEIRKLIEEEFRHEESTISDKFDSYTRYARDSTFLSVESDDSFGFLLRPFLEFFVASRIIRDIGEYDHSEDLGSLTLPLSPEIFSFIKSIIEADWLVEPHFFDSVQPRDEYDTYSKINKKKLLYKIISSNKKGKKGPNLSNVVRILYLAGGIVDSLDLSSMNLQGLDGRGMMLRDVDFGGSELSGSNFEGAILYGPKFTGARLNDIKFQDSRLLYPNFFRCILDTTDFSRAIIHDGEFSKARLTNLKFERAYLIEGSFTDSRINLCKFTNATLVKIDFRNGKFCDNNFDDATLLACEPDNRIPPDFKPPKSKKKKQ